MPSATPPASSGSTAARRTSRGGGCPAAAQRSPPVAPSRVTTTIVMNLPSAISSPTTPFAAARKSPGSGCSRASERNTNFAIAMSAAASTPCPLTSPSTTARRPSSSTRKSNTSPPTSRRADDSYARATSSPWTSGSDCGSNACCIDSRKCFCCWYSRALSTARAACVASDAAAASEPASSGRSESREITVSAAISSPPLATGTTTAVPPRSRKGASSSYTEPSSRASVGVSSTGRGARPAALPRRSPATAGGRAARGDRVETLVGDVHRLRHQHVAPHVRASGRRRRRRRAARPPCARRRSASRAATCSP